MAKDSQRSTDLHEIDREQEKTTDICCQNRFAFCSNPARPGSLFCSDECDRQDQFSQTMTTELSSF